ncbi:MAG: hypothetical protein IKQ97_09445 [Eubacterium sp.]|nr:hypothetical protein [Eubacterium sp.]
MRKKRKLTSILLSFALMIGLFTLVKHPPIVYAASTKWNTYYIHAYCEGSGIDESQKLVIKANVKKKKITIRGIGYKTKSKTFPTTKNNQTKYNGKTFKVAKKFRYSDEDVYAMGLKYITFRQAFASSKTVYGPLARIKIVKNKIVRIDCGS